MGMYGQRRYKNGIDSQMVRDQTAALSATVTYRPGMIPIVPLEMSHIHTTDCSTGMELLELLDSRICI